MPSVTQTLRLDKIGSTYGRESRPLYSSRNVRGGNLRGPKQVLHEIYSTINVVFISGTRKPS